MHYRTEYVPHAMTVRSIPADVLQIIAGPTECRVVIDIKRSYYRPVM